MDVDDLRRQLGVILDAEESKPADWSRVERLIAELEQQLRAEPDTVCPEVVQHFLSDPDIRARDDYYALRQREGVRRFVETGEYTDSTRVSPWTCALVVALVGGVLLWLLL